MNADMYSFADAEAQVKEFEGFLVARGIRVENGSDLERLCLNVFDVLHKHQVPAHQNAQADVRPWLREVLGMNQLIRQVLRVRHHPDVAKLDGHLRLLNRGLPAQNVAAPVTDAAANKVFELTVATAAMLHCGDIELDDPNHAVGDNPDVLAAFDGRAWGIACKVAHSISGQTLFDNLQKGVDQIDKSKADVGVVVINLKNVIKHDDYWSILNQDEWRKGDEPRFSSFINYVDALNKLKMEVDSIAARIRAAAGDRSLLALFDGRKALPAVLFYVPTAIGTLVQGMPMPAALGFLNLQEIGQVESRDRAVLNLLNDGMQSVRIALKLIHSSP
jgi:hypothetical protein